MQKRVKKSSGLSSLLIDSGYIAGLSVLSPYFFFKLLKEERYRRGLGQRLGFIEAPPCRSEIWLHCASVGEVNLTRLLVARLLQSFTCSLSSMTLTGLGLLRKLYPDARSFLLPLDLSPCVRRVFRTLSPRALILVELELWPNLVLCAYERDVRIVILNARISDEAFPRYRRIYRLVKPLLKRVSLVCAQNETYAERFRALGADSSKVFVTGNMKYDALPPYSPEREQAVKRELGLEGRVVLVAGSTHEGEDELLLRVLRHLRSSFPQLSLVLAPRHPERLDVVRRAVWSENFRLHLRSAGTPSEPPDVVVIDTMGELAELYRSADVVFVGGSFIPYGGHNVLEPASLKKPVITGEHFFNFKEEVDGLLSAGGLSIVRDEAELESKLKELLSNTTMRQGMGERARGVIARLSGATSRNLSLLKGVL